MLTSNHRLNPGAESRVLAWAYCLLCILAVVAYGQTSSSSGAIEGWALDPSQGPVPGAHVTAHSEQTSFRRATETDNQGYFRITDLPVGDYTLDISAPGFAAFEHKGVTVSLGSTVRADARLQLATQANRITVSGQPPLLDPSNTSMTNSVGHERIEESPVRTRNALDFVLMEPNVVSTNTAGGARASSGGLASSGFSLGGSRPTSNRIAIDGMENNDEFSGGSRTELSPEIVQEFQVVNNGISAESGGASGGAVNVVTRTGTDSMHGDAFVFLQNGALDARPPDEDVSTAPDLSVYRIGASNGGALVRDRTFYYFAFEQEHWRSQAASDLDPSAAAIINSALALGLYPAFPVRNLTTGFFPTARAETEASGKIDQQLSERSVLSLRYALTNNREAGDAFNNNGLSDGGSRGGSYILDQSLVGSWTFIAAPDAVNSLRAQVSRRDAVLRTVDVTGPEMVIAGLADFGQPYQGNQTYREDHADASDTYSWNRGRNLIQAGATMSLVHENTINPGGEGGLFLFANMGDFLGGRPTMYRQMFGDPNAVFSTPSYGGFFQDHWVMSQRLTLDAGLRYDVEQLPHGFPQDTHDFSPRAGIAFSPTSRMVIRAGYGIFFDRYLLASLDRAIVGNGVQGFEQVAEGFPAASILEAAAGASPLVPNARLLPSIYRADPALATPYSQQASLGWQYSVAKDIVASANYLFVRGVDLARTRNVNLTPPVPLADVNLSALDFTPVSGEPVFTDQRLDPLLNGVYQLEDSANSTYNGLSFAFRVQKEDFTLDTSYTYSKATDDASSWTEQPQNPYAAQADNGLSLFDMRHRFVLSGLFDLPIGDEENAPKGAPHGLFTKIFSNIELAPIFTAESGGPENPLTGLDGNGSESYPLSSRPAGYARNSLFLPPLVSLDLRILKAIPMGEARHLDLVAESFNLLNHTNVTAINPFFGAGSSPAAWFGNPIDALAGRQLQFSIDFEF